MAELNVYCYPWDFAADGAPESIAEWASDNGVDRLTVAAAYHSAEIIAPRRRTDVQVHVEANVSHLPIEAGFGALALPAGRLADERPALFPAVRAATSRSGVGLTGWVVALHNSDLAQRHPGTALRNCFGDRSAHGLCPAHPDVREYARRMTSAVAATGYFDEVLVESLAYLPGGHGHPHELWAVRMDPLCRVLLSLCFCEHCLAAGRAHGVDGSALRAWVADLLATIWNSPVSAVRDADDGAEVLDLVIRRPELAAWLRMRCEVVTSLLAEVAEGVHAHGVRIAAGGPVWARPLPFGWLEGIDVPAQLASCDHVVLMPYYEAAGAVARDLDHARALADPSRFEVLQTLWPAHHRGGWPSLAHKLELATSLGYRRFGLYNYSTAPLPALDWVRPVADLIRNGDQPDRSDGP